MPTANTVNEQDVSCLKHTMTFAMMFVNKNRLGSILFWTISCSPSMSVMIPAALHPAGFREIPDMRFYAPIKILREETDLRTQC